MATEATMKTKMMETLGEQGLTLPSQIEAALAANDRLKYYFSLLQVARSHADQPDQSSPSLRPERLVAGIADASLDHLVAAASKQGALYHLPGCGPLLTSITIDAHIMVTPADSAAKQRLEILLKQLPKIEGELIDGSAIDKITQVDRKSGDSLHRLVMDLHKQINALQVGLAEEQIDGAATYNLGPSDDTLIRAFMAGLNRTAPLKFKHPGLGTTATRSGTRLILQNDIGTTDAHVIVIHVEGRTVSLTYSDVHLRRLQFFRALFDRFAVVWTDPNSSQIPTLAGGAPFFMSTGTLDTTDDQQLLAYLGYLGSRLVFLIDWNRARKQLRGFLKAEQRLRLLRWAADSDIGHRGFLELGGARLIWDAVETTAAPSIHLGDRLYDVLGEEEAYAFVQFTFKTASEGLRARQSDGLIQDRICAELLNHLKTREVRLLKIAADHAGLIFEIGTAVRDSLVGSAEDSASLGKLAKRARRWEHEADQFVAETVLSVRQHPELKPFRELIKAADDAADQLEEVAFLLGLLESAAEPGTWENLQELSGIVAETTQEWVKAVGHAQHTQRHGSRGDADDFLTAIARVSELEHDADDKERAVTVSAMKTATDFRQLQLLLDIRQGLGKASDSLKRASLILRDHVVGDVLAA
jgi:uncharacterized protein Yka (UPF0111/DUF47 family)